MTDEERRQKKREYYYKNHEHILEYNRNYRAKNRTKIRNQPYKFSDKFLEAVADKIIKDAERWAWRNENL